MIENGNLLRPLFIEFEIPPAFRLISSVKMYVASSLHFQNCDDDKEFMRRVDSTEKTD